MFAIVVNGCANRRKVLALVVQDAPDAQGTREVRHSAQAHFILLKPGGGVCVRGDNILLISFYSTQGRNSLKGTTCHQTAISIIISKCSAQVLL